MRRNLERQSFFDLLAERHGRDLQKRLATARVAVAGLGGLGSHVALALARAGLGALHLIDFDLVDHSNLHRQAYFPRHLGLKKTEALAGMLAELNPWLDLRLSDTRLTAENIPEIMAGERILVEALDDPAAKAELVDTALSAFSDLKIVGASGLAGLGPAEEIVTRRFGRRLWLCGDGASEVRPGQGLICSRVMLCAGQQAHQVIRLLMEEEREDE